MRRLFPLFALFFALSAAAEINPEWTTPLPPFPIADNLYYVGSQELAAYLVTTPAGNILINANLETSPPQIRERGEAGVPVAEHENPAQQPAPKRALGAAT